VCPGCQSEFDPEAVIRSRRGRAATKDTAKAPKNTKGAALDEVADEDDIEDNEDVSSEGPGNDDDVEFDNDDIDINDDDEDDDRTGLIDDDLDDDEDILPGISKDDE